MAKGPSRERREPTLGPSMELGGEERPKPRPKRKKKRAGRTGIGRLISWAFTLCVWACVGAGILVAYEAAQLPPIDQLAIPKRPPNIAILAEDGTLLANRGDTGGAAVHLDELPGYLPKAFIAIEDRRFYEHWGIDPLGIARALVSNVTGRGNMQGGSTLTQQLAKNLFLTQERTLARKIQEAILAVWLEHKFTKDQILELYLNRVYFGSGAFGVEAAAQKYFGHSARYVSVSEAAMLAGLMKAPTRLAPNRNPEAAADRAQQVIIAMAQEGYITEPMAKLALAHPAEAVHDKGSGAVNYAADYVMDQLNDTIGAIDSDIVVTTTISAPLEKDAERALSEVLDAKAEHFGVTQGALVAIDTDGAVRVLIGGRNYAESQFNRATAAKRQPGSSFKPFVYLTAMEHGLTPDTIRQDAPINVRGWRPENYSHEYFGPVTLTKALALSLNTVAVRVGLEVGPAAIIKTARRLGITSPLQSNASIALGTSEVTPLELVGAYVPFANGGIGVTPYAIIKVATPAGKILYQHKPTDNGRVIDPQYVAMMNTMMEQTLAIGTAHKAQLPEGWQAAGKTGTSQDYRDAWFVGFTSHLVAGVWLGNDDNSPTKKASGANLPVEIWSKFMLAALQGLPSQSLPYGVWRNPNPFAQPAPTEPVASNAGSFFGLPFGGSPQPKAPMPIHPAAQRPLPGTSWRGNDNEAVLPPAPIGGASAPRDERRFFGLF
ncbi:MAG: transglycosylase domain-containing protein [Methylovirgula sp.]